MTHPDALMLKAFKILDSTHPDALLHPHSQCCHQSVSLKWGSTSLCNRFLTLRRIFYRRRDFERSQGILSVLRGILRSAPTLHLQCWADFSPKNAWNHPETTATVSHAVPVRHSKSLSAWSGSLYSHCTGYQYEKYYYYKCYYCNWHKCICIILIISAVYYI